MIGTLKDNVEENGLQNGGQVSTFVMYRTINIPVIPGHIFVYHYSVVNKLYESFEFMCSILVDTHKHAPSNRTQTSDLDVKNNWSARLDLKILSMSNRWSTCIFQYVFNIESYLVIY